MQDVLTEGLSNHSYKVCVSAVWKHPTLFYPCCVGVADLPKTFFY